MSIGMHAYVRCSLPNSKRWLYLRLVNKTYLVQSLREQQEVHDVTA